MLEREMRNGIIYEKLFLSEFDYPVHLTINGADIVITDKTRFDTKIFVIITLLLITLSAAVMVEKLTFNEDGSIMYGNKQVAAVEDSISYAVELTPLFIYEAIFYDHFFIYTDNNDTTDIKRVELYSVSAFSNKGQCNIQEQGMNIGPIIITKPLYPRLARRAGIEGYGTLIATLCLNDSICDVSMLRSTGNMLLDQAAIDAIQRAECRTVTVNDNPVNVLLIIPFKFKLKRYKL